MSTEYERGIAEPAAPKPTAAPIPKGPKVTGGAPLVINGTRFEPGTVITEPLTDEQAAFFRRIGAIE